jgi:hypothetical protein
MISSIFFHVLKPVTLIFSYFVLQLHMFSSYLIAWFLIRHVLLLPATVRKNLISYVSVRFSCCLFIQDPATSNVGKAVNL